jgi:hypothetical protein
MPPDLSHAIYIDSPLRGEWMAMNTPAERVPSHGTDILGQRYAYDFIRADKSGRRAGTESVWKQVLAAVPADSFFAWGQPVHAAYAGTVVARGEGWPDRKAVNALVQSARALFFTKLPKGDDYRPLAGNYLVIEGGVGFALYAHLRQGSVGPQPGDTVQAGEVIGRVGNSGNSTMPHLHFHVMDRADAWNAKGILCGFRNYERHTLRGWEPVAQGIPARAERFRVGGSKMG